MSSSDSPDTAMYDVITGVRSTSGLLSVVSVDTKHHSRRPMIIYTATISIGRLLGTKCHMSHLVVHRLSRCVPASCTIKRNKELETESATVNGRSEDKKEQCIFHSIFFAARRYDAAYKIAGDNNHGAVCRVSSSLTCCSVSHSSLDSAELD